MATSLEAYLPNVLNSDTRARLQAHIDVVNYLQDPTNPVQFDDLDKFIDGLDSWLNSSNYKISLNGLEVLQLVVDRMGESFKPHINTVLASVVNRLGDNKDSVRESSLALLLKLMVPASSPQYVFDRIVSAFTHKLWHVREMILICLQKTLKHYGAKSLSISKITPSICKLLDDQASPVRDAAIATLVEIYRHVGERVRNDLAKKSIAPSKLKVIFQKMDELKESGDMLPTATAYKFHSAGDTDDTDFVHPSAAAAKSGVSTAKRQSSAPVARRSDSQRSKSSIATKKTKNLTKKDHKDVKIDPLPGGAGALDEDVFTHSFENVPKIHLFSSRELVDHVTRIRDTLTDTNQEWEKRVDALKSIRSLVLAGAPQYDEFLPLLKTLVLALQTSVKDLRSQVVREACITISYLSQSLGNKFDYVAENVLLSLIGLMPNSAKIMATSGTVCVRFLIQNTHCARVIPIITGNLSSKSHIIRRECYCLLDILLHTWQTHVIERHIAILQEGIKKGLNDADSDARMYARKSFWGFSEHFKEQADSLLHSLDASKQRLLQGELSGASSSTSLNSIGGASVASTSSSRAPTRVPGSASAAKHRARSMSNDRAAAAPSAGTLPPSASLVRYGSMKRSTAGVKSSGYGQQRPAGHQVTRSRSAVDLANNDMTPARPHPVVATPLKTPHSNYNSLPRPNKTPGSTTATPSVNGTTSDQRSRNRSRSGVSQSQPSSRSGSPTSRISYLTHTMGTNQAMPATNMRPRRSGVPRSQGASRETSPSRYNYAGRERKISAGSSSHAKRGVNHRTQHVLSQRVLPHGTDMEAALSSALSSPMNRRYDFESADDASETSSICSDHSFYSSYGRTAEDISEIVSNLQSSSWGDRRDGLVNLQTLLRSNRILNRVELKKITEIFTRMFHDPHGKVFSLFLETLVDLLSVHRSDLQDWLYALLTRLINKMGSDLLGSVQLKVQRMLDVVRESFPCDHQFNILTRFIIDQTQTPNLKAKLALLHYLHNLVQMMDPADFSNTCDTRLSVSRLVTWTTEPKNVEVRKAAQAVLIALFNLNSPEFSMMLSGLPKTFQDGATKILHNHLRSNSMETEPLSPHNVTSPTSLSGYRQKPSPQRTNIDDIGTENVSPEIYNLIRKTSADIQNLNKLDHQFNDVKKDRDSTSQDSGIQNSMSDVRTNSPLNKAPVGKNQGRAYNHHYYQDKQDSNGFNRSALEEAIFDDEKDLFNQAFSSATSSPDVSSSSPWKNLLGIGSQNDTDLDQNELIQQMQKELSNHNTRNEERKGVMMQLIKMTREGTLTVWEEHFKTILLLLLEMLGDSDSGIRALSLRVLREILRHQPSRFHDYAELTIMKILECNRDDEREVCRAAEECAATLAAALPPSQSVRVLKPIIQTADKSINHAALKMLSKVVEAMDAETVTPLLQEIIPSLMKGYDNTESRVRKTSVFCLVSIYMIIGEELRPHIQELSASKMKLLDLYIKRSLNQRGSSSENHSKATSPTSDI